MELWQNAVLIAATVTTGLVAGLLFAWAVSVMPGLRGSDDATYISTFREMDAAIVSNVYFVIAFVGAPLLTVAAVLLHLDDGARLAWIIAALGLSLATIGITRIVHLPLNAQVKASATVGDVAPLRQRFESRWVRWNIVRTATSTAALACLAVALVL
jgi:uncharacterized membrane protein